MSTKYLDSPLDLSTTQPHECIELTDIRDATQTPHSNLHKSCHRHAPQPGNKNSVATHEQHMPVGNSMEVYVGHEQRPAALVCGSHRTPKMNSIPRCLPGLSHGLRGHTARSHKMAPMLQQLPAGHVGRTRSLHLLHSWRWLGTHTRALQWPLIQTT
jgi:hypothetical protein